jgi:hypothetical protein
MKASLRVAGVCLVGGLSIAGVSNAQQSVHTECRAADLGRACDPDGAGADQGDCDGVCVFDSDTSVGTIVCIPISILGIQSLEHHLCGTGAECSQTCNQAGQCVSVAAVDDTACHSANKNAPCSGRCVSGACQAIAPAEQCALGPDASGCGFRTCSTLNAKNCINYSYPTIRTCNTGTCDGCGACVATPTASSCVNPGQCGNGRLDPGEMCDGSNLSGETCASLFGQSSTGTLRCSASCAFATSECTGVGGAGGTAGAGGAGDGGIGGAGGQAGTSATGGTGGSIDGGAEGGAPSTGGSSGAPAGGNGGLGSGGTESGAGGTLPASGGSGATAGAGGLADGGSTAQAGTTAKVVPRLAEGGGCDCRTSSSNSPLRGHALIGVCGVLVGAAWRRRARVRR